MLKALTIIFCFISVLSSAVEAKEVKRVSIPIQEYVQSPLAKMTFPAIFVWEQEQQPAYFHSGKYDNKVINEIVNGKQSEITNINSFEFLKEYLKQKDSWSSKDKMLVFAKIDKSIGECEPCTTSEESAQLSMEKLQQGYTILNLVLTN